MHKTIQGIIDEEGLSQTRPTLYSSLPVSQSINSYEAESITNYKNDQHYQRCIKIIHLTWHSSLGYTGTST